MVPDAGLEVWNNPVPKSGAAIDPESGVEQCRSLEEFCALFEQPKYETHKSQGQEEYVLLEIANYWLALTSSRVNFLIKTYLGSIFIG